VQRPIGAQGASPTLMTMITSTGHDQLSTITSRSTYNGRSDLTPECHNSENQRQSQETISESAQLRLQCFYLSEVHLSQFACTPTALATSKKPTCGGMVQLLIPDTLLERRIPTDEDQSTNEALPRQERLPKRSELTEKSPYDCRTLRMRSFASIEANL